eukprot:5153726-Pleurochrysis_carterae.AAC.6
MTVPEKSDAGGRSVTCATSECALSRRKTRPCSNELSHRWRVLSSRKRSAKTVAASALTTASARNAPLAAAAERSVSANTSAATPSTTSTDDSSSSSTLTRVHVNTPPPGKQTSPPPPPPPLLPSLKTPLMSAPSPADAWLGEHALLSAKGRARSSVLTGPQTTPLSATGPTEKSAGKSIATDHAAASMATMSKMRDARVSRTSRRACRRSRRSLQTRGLPPLPSCTSADRAICSSEIPYKRLKAGDMSYAQSHRIHAVVIRSFCNCSTSAARNTAIAVLNLDGCAKSCGSEEWRAACTQSWVAAALDGRYRHDA